MGSPFRAPARETSLTFESGTKEGAVMWNICFPFREERVEEVLDVLVFLADLKPCGGLYCWGAPKGLGFESLVR